MTNTFTLANLVAELDREFAPMTLDLGGEMVVLRNVMRVDEKDREAVLSALDDIGESKDADDETVSPEELAKLSGALRLVLEKVTADGKGAKLVSKLGGDLLLSMKVLEQWVEATQPGEAESSPA